MNGEKSEIEWHQDVAIDVIVGMIGLDDGFSNDGRIKVRLLYFSSVPE